MEGGMIGLGDRIKESVLFFTGMPHPFSFHVSNSELEKKCMSHYLLSNGQTVWLEETHNECLRKSFQLFSVRSKPMDRLHSKSVPNRRFPHSR